MHQQFNARWISKPHIEALNGTGVLAHVMLLDTYKGFIVIEPADQRVGDGELLSLEEAEYELQEVWFMGPKAKLREARRRLGLEQRALASA